MRANLPNSYGRRPTSTKKLTASPRPPDQGLCPQAPVISSRSTRSPWAWAWVPQSKMFGCVPGAASQQHLANRHEVRVSPFPGPTGTLMSLCFTLGPGLAARGRHTTTMSWTRQTQSGRFWAPRRCGDFRDFGALYRTEMLRLTFDNISPASHECPENVGPTTSWSAHQLRRTRTWAMISCSSMNARRSGWRSTTAQSSYVEDSVGHRTMYSSHGRRLVDLSGSACWSLACTSTPMMPSTPSKYAEA